MSNSQKGSVLIFDGDCSFCTSVAAWSARRFQDGDRAEAWQQLDVGALDRYGLSTPDVQSAAWWVDESGLRERGHRAIGRALYADGGLWKVLGWFVLTPPTSYLAKAIYKVVVRWRHRLPGGTPACGGRPLKD